MPTVSSPGDSTPTTRPHLPPTAGLTDGCTEPQPRRCSTLSPPPVTLLDGQWTGGEVELRQSMWALLRKVSRDGHTVSLTTHYLEEADALCGRIAMMKAGRIVALDTTRHLLSRFAGLTVRVSAERLPEEWASRLHRREGPVYYLGLENYAELERLLASFRNAGVAIDELALAETDLEQVFLRIMAGSETTDETQPGVAIPEA